jgi:hypothetical protein
VSFTVADLNAIILHHLVSAWFAFGTTLVQQVDGLAMGSALACALTRMVLVFLDVTYYWSILSTPLPPISLRGCIRVVCVRGVDVVLLEVRHVDDYLALWKNTTPLPDELVAGINAEIRSRLRWRYNQLPVKDDDSGIFVGLRIVLSSQGTVSISPAPLTTPQYSDEFDFCAFMSYRSYAPSHMKRAVIIGCAARVERFTIPAADKPNTLADLLKPCLLVAGFPVALVRRWLLDCRRGHTSWIAEVPRLLDAVGQL